MRRNISILFFVLLFSCSSREQKLQYSIPKRKDINAIVKAVIYQNKLPVLKYRKFVDTLYDKNGKRRIFNRQSFPLCVNLEKYTVLLLTNDTSINGLLPPPNTLLLEELLSVKVDGENFFSKSDSAYFLFLNDSLKAFSISKKFSKTILETSNTKKFMERILGERNPYFSISIPIFSKDNTKAYVIVGFYCFLCGYETGIYLKKIDGKWAIVKTQGLWVS